MPFCPKCKYEYRTGFSKCPDCDVELVDELPEAAKPLDESLDLVCIGTYPFDPPAQAARVTLESQGIPTVLQNSVMSQTDIILVFADGGVRLMVRSEDVQRAKSILEDKGE
ncbi:MAG: DUF2007 domain-containing protein [Armatimonadota bacterium]|nr:DUF2007 domain-containing protein [bacterium]